MKRLALGLVTGAATLGLIVGTGVADAKITSLPNSFPTTATYKAKQFSGTITNNSSEQVTCMLGFYEPDKLPQLQAAVKRVNDVVNGDVDPDEVPDDINDEVTPEMIDDEFVTTQPLPANGGKAAVTWTNTTDKAPTEVAVLQACIGEMTILNPGTEEQEYEWAVGYSAFKVGSSGITGGNGGGNGGAGSMDLDGILGGLDLFGSLG